ncbi:MAG: YggS family pyridoxal phosphate-dependent enzyme [Steroidobacteraceae bacterium]
MLGGPQNWVSGYETTRRRIAAAAERHGRTVDSITLLGVSKGQPAAAIAALAQLGLWDIGENYLQEALEKMASVGERDLTWHFIGHLQSNKTRVVAERFHWVHAVDRLKIAERLSAQRPFHGAPLNVCLHVNIAAEPGKGGVAPAELEPLAAAVAQLPRLRLRGLMCLPPAETSFDRQRHWFDATRALYDALNAKGMKLDTLSMGMSADLEAAIAAGATIVRVGTALFGPRPAA